MTVMFAKLLIYLFDNLYGTFFILFIISSCADEYCVLFDCEKVKRIQCVPSNF